MAKKPGPRTPSDPTLNRPAGKPNKGRSGSLAPEKPAPARKPPIAAQSTAIVDVEPPPRGASFPVAGVGASAGGLEAFTALLKALPADTGIAFVLVQHMDPTHDSILPKLLAKATAMPVLEAGNGMLVEPNHVYVTPPNARMTISQGVLRITSRVEGSGRNLPIDAFFCALAADLQRGAIGIVLSGLASDGTQGLEAIKAEGGITFAQDESSARYSGMPLSAAAAGCVDFVLPPETIAAELTRLGPHPYIRTQQLDEPPLASANGEEGIRRICAVLRTATGVDFELYKPATIRRRIARRMLLKKVDGLEKYLPLLVKDRTELDALCEDIFIHVTGFFRDPDALQALGPAVFAKVLAKRPPGQPLRVWVPGCSSGEEAYSIAMILLEGFGKKISQTGLQIFGTDVSERAVDQARMGIYPESAMSQVSPARRKRFFVKLEGGFQIAKSVRELCIFARHDLTRDPPFSKLDLISCRNVLIYMGPALQKRIVETLHYALKPEGHLMLGKSESLGGHTSLFSLDDRKNKIYFRRPGTGPHLLGTAFPESVKASQAQVADAAVPRTFDMRREAERVLLEQLAPAALVVDHDLNIVHFHGNTSPYLAPAAGDPSFHLLRMLRPEILVDVRALIQKSKESGAGVRKEQVRYRLDGQWKMVDLLVAPVKGQHPRQTDFLVVFQARAGQATKPVEPAGASPEWKGRPALEIARLEGELASSRDQLRSLVEDYEAAKEEMNAIHEETLSNSEELQSTNEELETAKEELQSSNEELITLNDELQSRNGELGQLTHDLSNLLIGVDIPVVILDGALRIRRFTPAAEAVFSLIPTDVGRPFTDIASRIDVPNWEDLIRRVIAQQHIVNQEVRDREGRWYGLRMRPYYGSDRKVDGILMALLDIDSVRRSLDEVREARDFAEAIVETVREPLVVLNAELRVLRATHSFYETFQVGHSETEGRPFFDLGDGQWNIPRLRALLEEMLPGKTRVENFEVAHDFPSIGHRKMVLNARRIYRESEGTVAILLAIEDVTERAHSEALAHQRELTIQNAASQAILSVGTDGRIVMANRMAETMFGYSREELLELPVESLLPERFRNAHPSQRAAYFAEPELQPRQMGSGPNLRGLRKDGTEFPIATTLNHIHTRDGTISIDFITDLTEKQRTEEALRESEERFSLFMEHLPSAAFMKDLEGRYVYVSPGFVKLTGRAPGLCLGASDEEYWPASARRLREQDRYVMETGRALISEDARSGPDGVRHYQTVKFPIPGKDGATALVAGVSVDITERKLAEQERQILSARLATAQEEERRRISRELHDDLTQRLAGLAMEIGSLVAKRPASAPVVKEDLRALQSRVVQAAEVARHIAHQLHPSELDDLGLVAALRSYCEDFSRREGIAVEFVSQNVPKELKREIASCLYKVTQESLSNSSKHAGAKAVSVTLSGTADRINLSVKDTGVGFRTRWPGTSVGLGILSMKERVGLLHGTFGITSDPGHGTEITAEIPLEAL